MRISIILGHPNPDSFNHAIADTASHALSAAGHAVILHDLSKEGFDPILPAAEIPRGADLDPVIERHCREIADTDGIIVVHPNWWGQPPAILKGWVDRVLRPGVAYRFFEGDAGEGVPEGLLSARAAIVFNTSNTQKEREMAVFGDPLEALWKRCIFGLCGVERVERKVFSVVVTSTLKERQDWLAEVRETVTRVFPANFGA